MNMNDVIAALDARLGAPSNSGNATWESTDGKTTVTVTELTNCDGPDRVEVNVFGVRVESTSLTVAETVNDFVWRIARRETATLGTIAPLAVVVEAVAAMMGLSRFSYNEVLAAFTGDFGSPTSALAFVGAKWLRDDRVLHISLGLAGVTVAMIEGDETREHLIVETTATPYAAERFTYDEAMRKSGSCSLANAIDAARVFLAHGHYRGRSR